MKILYIGHYKEGTGWSNAAINNILALNTIPEIDLVTRNIKLAKEVDVPEDITKLEEKTLKDIDICIQHVLPHHLVASDKFKKNIAYFASETNTIKYASNWLQMLKCMDEVWVPCCQNSENLKNDGVDNVKVVPHTFNMSKYIDRNPIRHNFPFPQNSFTFYYIGDLNRRKNLENIIRCFHVAFSPSEPVELILKVSSPAKSNDVLKQEIEAYSNKVKSELRLYRDLSVYKKEQIIANYISDQDVVQLHKLFDCYVGPSHGEGFSIPAFEAMALGKTPICSNDGGPKDFIDPQNKSTGTLVGGTYKICNNTDSAFPFLGTGREYWFEPNDIELINAMKYYYENRNLIDRSNGFEQAQKFSYENISKLMLEYINE